MSRRGRVLAIALVTALVPLAGCFGGEEGLPSNIQVDASQPLAARGFAYDGSVVEADGSARLLADNASGSGSFTANVTLDGTPYTFSADTFQAQPDAPWTGNGVNQSVTLHGDTGRASTSLPAMQMVAATWGPIQVTRGGEIISDPLTGEPTFFGHVMVTETGVRSDDDGSIRAEDGSVYAPSKAGSGRTVEGDRELHLEIKSARDARTYEDSTVEDSGQLTPEQPNASMPIEVRQTLAQLAVNVSVSAPNDAPVPPAETTVTLLDPSGTEQESATLGGTGNTSASWQLDSLPSAGNWSVELESQGAANWEAQASVDYPEPFFLYVVFEEASWQAASGE